MRRRRRSTYIPVRGKVYYSIRAIVRVVFWAFVIFAFYEYFAWPLLDWWHEVNGW
jgi:hypothetical protein